MKHELEDQLKAFEKKGIDRRHFFKLMAMAGLLTAASTQKAKAFSSKAKGKIVIIGGGAAGISMAARLKSTTNGFHPSYASEAVPERSTSRE